jgi:hypothetical protein
LQVCPYEATPAGLAALTAHGLLSQLEQLQLYDAELPCSCIAEHLAGASRLSALQFGVNSVTPDLPRLPALKAREVL